MKSPFVDIDIIRQHIREKDYLIALSLLTKSETKNLSSDDLAHHNLLFSECKIGLGDYCVERHILDAINFFKYSSDNYSFAKAKFLHGLLLISQGKNSEAHEALIESYVSYKRCDNLEGCSHALNRLAFVQLQSGAIDDAVGNLEKCIQINETLANTENVATLKRNLAAVYFMSGAFSSAITKYSSIKSEMRTHAAKSQFQYYLTYAMATALQGDIKKALRLIDKTTRYPNDYKREKAQYYEYLGWTYNLDEKYEKAVEVLKTGIKLSLKIAPESALISQSKRLLADAYIGLGKYDLAEETANEALNVAEKINERVEIAASYRVFALAELSRGNKEKSRNLFMKAMEIFSLIQSRYELAVTRYQAAKSGCYDNGERDAMLYLARGFFESEDVHKFVKKIDKELASRPKFKINRNPEDKNCPVFITADPKMKKLVELAENVARSDMTILLTGPTGAGKDQLAKYIHYCSGRKGEFVTVNSAAIPDSMVESELFGFRKGAFTGAERNNPGLMAGADGGTFYLNEIADATPEFQAKLLEVIETKTIRPLGGGAKKKVDIRIIAATNHNLEQRMREGKFRLDLYHRLNMAPIHLPALSERPKDIPVLVKHFLCANGFDLRNDGNPEQLDRLCQYLSSQCWTGNVRELKGYIDRLCLLADGDLGRMSEIAGEGNLTEREILLKILNETGWNRHETARILGISEGTVRNRIKQFNLQDDSIA